MPGRRRTQPRQICLPLLATLACSGGSGSPAPAASTPSAPRSAPPPAGTPSASAQTAEEPTAAPASLPTTPQLPTTGSETATPIVHADAPASVGAKSEVALFIERKGVRDLYALTATPAPPDWSAPLDGDLAALRDDDLLSGVTCPQGHDKPCAIGLAFPEPVPLRAIRLSTAFGPRWRDFDGTPRVREVRLHTDAGSIDVELKDGQTARYVLLADPVTTRSLAVEARGAHGASTAPYFFAEIEAYGASGPMREPLAVDPAALFYRFDSERWKDRGTTHEIRPSHAERLDADGAPRRLAAATAAYGQAGDRLLLFETVREATCQGAVGGSYVVLDTQRRLWVDVGQLGALGGAVYRKSDGLGFAVGAWDDAEKWPQGLILGDEGLKRIRVGKAGLADGTPDGQLAAWGMDGAPARSGIAGEVGAPPAGCSIPTAEGLARLGPLPGIGDDPARWLTCPLGGGGELLVHTPAACPGAWTMKTIDAGGNVLSSKTGTESGRSPRLWPRGEGAWLIELDRDGGDDGDLYLVDPTGALTEVARGAGGPLRPPAACGCTNPGS